MPRTSQIPKYPEKPHRSGGARIRLGGRDVYLTGPFGSEQSLRDYDRRIAEWLASGRAPIGTPADGSASIREAVERYWHFAKGYYVKAGKPTRQAARIRQCLDDVLALYADLPAAEFSPLKLKAVRERMIARGWCRSNINMSVACIVRAWKWLAGEEVVPADTWQALRSVPGLKRGRTQAPEGVRVLPAPESAIAAAQAQLLPQVRAMTQVQLLTAMRPGEVLQLRPQDIDRNGPLPGVWLFRPARHKTEHHGRERLILIGPQAQAVLAPYLFRDPDAYCFDPREAIEQHARGEGVAVGRRRRRAVGKRYSSESYCRAVARACERAIPPPEHLARGLMPRRRVRAGVRAETNEEWKTRLGLDGWAKLEEWCRKHWWSPNQLRHNAATRLKDQFGWDVARVILGHTSVSTTAIYAESNLQAAAAAMAQAG